MIDHVIYGTRDLAAAGHTFWAEHGLASYEGGVHPQYGTANRIVPLGDTYIELMGVADAAVARQNPLGLYLLEQTAAGDRWFAWCLRTTGIDGVARRIGSAAVPGERHLPGGEVVRWRLAGLEIALAEPPLPFFIEWDPSSPHPGATALAHRCGTPRIARVEATGDARRLAGHIGAEHPSIAIVDGPPSLRVVIATDEGEITP